MGVLNGIVLHLYDISFISKRVGTQISELWELQAILMNAPFSSVSSSSQELFSIQ